MRRTHDPTHERGWPPLGNQFDPLANQVERRGAYHGAKLGDQSFVAQIPIDKRAEEWPHPNISFRVNTPLPLYTQTYASVTR